VRKHGRTASAVAIFQLWAGGGYVQLKRSISHSKGSEALQFQAGSRDKHSPSLCIWTGLLLAVGGKLCGLFASELSGYMVI